MFVKSYYYGNLHVFMFLQFAEAGINTEPCMAILTQHVEKYRGYIRKRFMDKSKTGKEICESFCSRPRLNKQTGSAEYVSALFAEYVPVLWEGWSVTRLVKDWHVLIETPHSDWTTIYPRFIPGQGDEGVRSIPPLRTTQTIHSWNKPSFHLCS